MKSQLELKPNQTIVFIGDSITDADRTEQAYKPFGFGYVHFAANWLLAKYPEYNLNIVNTGISGNTVRDLKARWKRDCLDHKPDILSILIGINDIWRRYDGRLDEAVPHEEYELTYKQLLLQVKEKNNCQIVLMEPFMFCGDEENQMFNALKACINIVGNFAKEFDAVLVPMQALIGEKLKQVKSDKWSDDMVHPYLWAHAWIAQQWLKHTGV